MFCVLERCIEVVGARRAGEKNRRPTSYYDVQSCAMEQRGALFCKYSSSEKKKTEGIAEWFSEGRWLRGFSVAFPDGPVHWLSVSRSVWYDRELKKEKKKKKDKIAHPRPDLQNNGYYTGYPFKSYFSFKSWPNTLAWNVKRQTV